MNSIMLGAVIVVVAFVIYKVISGRNIKGERPVWTPPYDEQEQARQEEEERARQEAENNP